MMTKRSGAAGRARDAAMIGLLRLAAGRGETNGFEEWREGLLLDSPRSASSIPRESGIDGALLMLELDLYLAVRLTDGVCGFVIESE